MSILGSTQCIAKSVASPCFSWAKVRPVDEPETATNTWSDIEPELVLFDWLDAWNVQELRQSEVRRLFGAVDNSFIKVTTKPSNTLVIGRWLYVEDSLTGETYIGTIEQVDISPNDSVCVYVNLQENFPYSLGEVTV